MRPPDNDITLTSVFPVHAPTRRTGFSGIDADAVLAALQDGGRQIRTAARGLEVSRPSMYKLPADRDAAAHARAGIGAPPAQPRPDGVTPCNRRPDFSLKRG